MNQKTHQQLIKSIKSLKGFTLVEVLIVMFVAGLLLAAFFTMFNWHSRMYNYQQALVRTSGSNRASLQSLDFYVSQGYRILASWTIDGTVYSSASSSLVVQLPSIDNSGNVFTGKWDYVVFYADGNNFYQLIQADNSSSRRPGKKLLSDTLSSVTFTYGDPDFSLAKMVAVDLQTQAQAREQLIKDRLQQNIYLKNH